MAVTVVGSVAFDALETPFGKRERILGGAATHFSLAASFFTDVRVVGVVGEDFGPEELAVFEGRGVNTARSSGSPAAARSSGRPLRRRHAGRAHARHAAERVRGVRPGALGGRARLVGRLPREHPARPAAARARAVHGRRSRRPRLDELLDRVGPRLAARDDARRRRRRAERRRDPHAHGRAEPVPGGPADPGARPEGRRRQAGQLRRVRVHRGGLLLRPRLPAGDGRRPDRRRRLVRRRLLRLPRPHAGTVAHRRRAPLRGRLRLGARLVRDRGVRQRAAAAADDRRDRSPFRRVQADDALRAGAGSGAPFA